MRNVYIKPDGKDKFSYVVMHSEEQPADSAYIKVDSKTITELHFHKLCWDNGQLVPYVKTEEDIAKEKAEKAKAVMLAEIMELKQKLADTDYQAIKYAEGEISLYEYEPIKAERRYWRSKINELEFLVEK